jgi:hypothetical protein
MPVVVTLALFPANPDQVAAERISAARAPAAAG